MNKLIIIGNLTRDPESRVTAGGQSVTTFTVAVNRRTNSDHPQADYFRVSAWDKLGSTCVQYLAKGRKVAVTGPVRATAYIDRSGQAKAELELTAESVEFLTPRGQTDSAPAAPADQPANSQPSDPSQFIPVDDSDLSF